jgi:cell division protease FtsH
MKQEKLKWHPMQTKIPIGDLIDKLRSFFGFGDRPKNQSALPAKKRFSIWYFVIAMILFSYLQPIRFFFKDRDDFL